MGKRYENDESTIITMQKPKQNRLKSNKTICLSNLRIFKLWHVKIKIEIPQTQTIYDTNE